MPLARVTYTIEHLRTFDTDEERPTADSPAFLDRLVWAAEEGAVTITVEGWGALVLP